jgi:trigger factor
MVDMKISVKNLSPTRVVLTITLASDDLADAEKVALHKLSKKVKVAGFRTGKVPASIAAKHVDPQQLALEAADNAVSKAVAEAFVSKDIRALERPQVEVVSYDPGKELTFTAEADIMPKIKLADYKKLAVKKLAKATVKAADVDEVLTRIRTQMSTKEPVERAAKDGDEVLIDFIGKKDGVAFDGGTATDYALTLGSATFIPGFEEAIVGQKKGDAFDVPAVFPKDYRVADLAGQKVVFSVKLSEVREAKLPELNDEFAAKVGPYTSASELTDDIKRELAAQKVREADEKLRNDLVEALAAKSTAPVPNVIKQAQLSSIEQDMTQNLMYQGLSLEQYFADKNYKDRDEWIEKEASQLAEKRAKASIVLAELSRIEKIAVTEDEKAARIAQFQQQYGKNEQMAAQLKNPEVLRDIENQLVIDKTIDRLVELNK